MAWVTRAKFLYKFKFDLFQWFSWKFLYHAIECTYNNKAESSNNTSTVHSTYHYRGQYFFSQNVFNSFSTIENWMGVMALSIYFGKTSIEWEGIILVIFVNQNCAEIHKNWHCAISMHTLIYLNDNFKAHVNSASSACLSSNCEEEKIESQMRLELFFSMT